MFPLNPIPAANQLTIIIVIAICNNSQSIKKQNNKLHIQIAFFTHSIIIFILKIEAITMSYL